MSYRQKKLQRRKNLIYFFMSVFILLAIFTPFYDYLYRVLEKPFINAYKNTAQLKKDGKNIFHTWYSKKKIIEENEKLEREVAMLRVDNLRTTYLSSLLEKNAILQGYDVYLSTSIITKNNSGTITILGGKDKEVSIGDVIIHNDGTLLGVVSKVFNKSSQVDLFIKEGIISHSVLFPQNISIEMKGNGNAMLTELNRDIEVHIGDIVYAQNEPGYIMGKVSAIDFDPRDPVKKVYIAPIHGIQSLQQVGIIKAIYE